MVTLADWMQSCGLDLLDARALVEFVCDWGRSEQMAHPQRTLADESWQRLTQLADQRRAGVPLAYLLGQREFFSLRFLVTPDVLIPRPETELLVEEALRVLEHRPHPIVLDLGTGSGCIAVSIAKHAPQAKVWAIDRSPAALMVASSNAVLHAVHERMVFLQSDWFVALPAGQRFDLIVANPPYIAEGDEHLRHLSYEPVQALVSGSDGMTDLHTIIERAPEFLQPGATLMLEHSYDQAASVRMALVRCAFIDLRCLCDIAGLARVSSGRLVASR